MHASTEPRSYLLTSDHCQTGLECHIQNNSPGFRITLSDLLIYFYPHIPPRCLTNMFIKYFKRLYLVDPEIILSP